jgi:hypothetical protein
MLLDELKLESLSANYSIEYSSIFSRIQKELLNLIGTFLAPSQLKQIKKEIEQHTVNKELIKKYLNPYCVEIASNVSSFCLNNIKSSSSNTSFLIFTPKIENNQLHSCNFHF